MIPHDENEMYILAGEYALGVLEEGQRREVERELSRNAALRSAVEYWERRLHPLSSLARAGARAPGEHNWTAIAARIGRGSKTAPPRRIVGYWQAATIALAAACIALYLTRPAPPPQTLVSILRAQKTGEAGWVALVTDGRMTLRPATSESAPRNRSFELWAIAPQAKRPLPLGVIGPKGTLVVATAPAALRRGATLAVSIEPPGGSPTGLPTGPVVFTGMVEGS